MTAHPPKPTVPYVRGLIYAYYAKPGNGAGGVLHVVLDDNNIQDKYVRGCLEDAIRLGDSDGARLAELLLQMSWSQRHRLTTEYRPTRRSEP